MKSLIMEMQDEYQSALIAYIEKNEGLLWHAILKLQSVDAILKPSIGNIYEYLKLNSPNLLLININAISSDNSSLIAGSVCRWSQSNLRELKVFLVNPYRAEVSDLERRWAIRRGAIDVLPKLTSQNALNSIRKVLDTIGKYPQEEVTPTLLNLIEKYNPTPELPEEETTLQKIIEAPPAKEVIEPSIDSSNGNNEGEYIIYRGVKVPRFSVASTKHQKLTYRGIPIKPKEND